MKITAFTNNCGVLIEEIDLANLTDSDFESLQQAFVEHGLLFFRDQSLSPKQHKSLANKFGDIVVNKIFKTLEGFPEIAVVSKEKQQTTNIGGGWHTDHSYDEEPAMASILVARELPSSGGATKFANMYAAYEGLSEGLKSTLSLITAKHSNEHLYGKGGYFSNTDLSDKLAENVQVSSAMHPVIVIHPESHKPVLYVNKAHTIGFDNWHDDEAFALLNFLYEHGSKPEYTCEFDWQPGSVAIWDNRSTWHFANNDYQGEMRTLHRITIKGSSLAGPVCG
ncbi:TauD/TfdA family dioxygenase [Shewanella sp. ULN5]|uniref:TauD/TfdA dioxygenase family protein n=1 Tax=Shewanella sp. ULN5 TaxID=2994678 RepID=UPI00273D05C0|nr:TauD/TfdA family dioxygenase [Shewanella sp. ULN5]MDP5148231.1 TauD/TfdA family dioxygenase [Shewanella sp. ULN5]